jgi:two-component system OmpR family response regulator
LVVDDYPGTTEILALCLELLGFRCEHALDGDTALARAETFRPHVVLLDLWMPRHDGFKVARALRERAGREPYIVAMTASTRYEDRERAYAVGVDAHVMKPIGLDGLRQLMRDAMRRVRRCLGNVSEQPAVVGA